MRILAATLILLTFHSVSQAQSVCEESFANKGLYLDTSEYSPELQEQHDSLNILTLNLLKMTAATKSAAFSEKQVVEKGDLTLAQNLNDGWSVEFSYSADHRGETPIFRIKDITLIKPNGEKESLDKSPATLSGQNLKKGFYSFKDIDSSLENAQVNIPAVIYGSVFKKISEWALVSEYLKRGELQAITTDLQFKSLRAKVFTRSTVDYSRKVIKKQSFKFLLLGVVMYLWSQREELKSFESLDPAPLSSDPLLDSPAVFKFDSEIPADLALRRLSDIARATNTELQLGGVPTVSFFSQGQIQTISIPYLELFPLVDGSFQKGLHLDFSKSGKSIFLPGL